MAHLSGFGLENFRVFKEYTWFDFAPITILVGPNNSGKSSLIKALLLLQDNLKKGNLPPYFDKIAEGYSSDWQSGETDYNDYNEAFEPSILEFNDRVHGLNKASTTKNRFCDKDELIFDIPFFTLTKFERKMTGKQFFQTNSKTNIRTFLSQIQKISKDFPNPTVYMRDKVGTEAWDNKLAFPLLKCPIYRLSFKINDDTATTLQKLEIRDEDLRLLLKITANEVFFDPTFYSEYHGDYSTIEGPWDRYQNLITASHGISFKYWFLQNGFSEEKAIELSKKILRGFFLTEDDSKINSSQIKESLQSIDYFSTSWTEQRRVYTEDHESKTISQLTNLVAQQKKGFNLKSFFEAYTQFFGIKGIPNVEYDKARGILFPNIDGESLLSFGYGYSQIALILFKVATHVTQKYILLSNNELTFNEESTILILEEPETNLHPSLQSKLANLIFESKNDYNIQYLIETHSEYMIRKFQYLVAKGEMKPEDIVIHYFNDPNNIPAGEKQVKKITILEDGSLSDDFGPGFYDEAATWELELLKLKRNKNRQN